MNYNIRILSENTADRATVTSSSPIAAGLPLSNLKTNLRGQVCRSLTNSLDLTLEWPELESVGVVVLPLTSLLGSSTIRVKAFLNASDTTPMLDTGVVYASSGVVAGARLFESTFDVPYAYALWLGAAATILYTLIGGFLAVSWTDTVQASLMIAALIIAPLTVIYLCGGVAESLAVIRNTDPEHLNMFRGTSSIGIISLLAWGLGYFGQPHILARFMSASSYAAIAPARRISITWMVLCLAGAIAVGFFGVAYFATNLDQAAPVIINAERVFIVLAQVLFNPWIAGILLSAILAAIMSTLSCQLLVCSSALTEDFYKAFLRPAAGQKELVWVGRLTVLLVALVAIGLAQDPHNSVLSLVSYAWGGFGAAFGPVVIISLLWRRMTRNGALFGMLVGALTVLFWKQGVVFGVRIVPESWQALYEILPGAVFATLTIVVVSLMGKPPAASIRATFDAVDAEVKSYYRTSKA